MSSRVKNVDQSTRSFETESVLGEMGSRGINCASMLAVAAQARVSIATVSRTINNVPTVSPKLARRVQQAMRDLGYSPNRAVQRFASGRSRFLGLIVSEITNPFFPPMIQEFEAAALEHDYDILVATTRYDRKYMELCIRRMIERRVEGVAIMTSGLDMTLVDRLVSRQIPTILMNNSRTNGHYSTIEVDYIRGIKEAVQYLAALGHRKIAFISGPPGHQSAQARQNAFLRTTAEIGLNHNPNWLKTSNHTLTSGVCAMNEILKVGERPTAVMCSNDITAIGALRAIFNAGLSVPEDFSVIGFDNISAAEFTAPPLTSVQMSGRELAQCAVEALQRRPVALPLAHHQQYRIATRLVVRRSTGVAREN